MLLNKKKRHELEKKLSDDYDKAFAKGDMQEVLRINAMIEKCWLIDDAQGVNDPMLDMFIGHVTREYYKKPKPQQINLF